jgi:hypothetical protein
MKTSKTIFLLNIDNKFAPEITRLTYPFIRCYAEKIGANIHIITERKYPDWPITYEKIQIYDLARSIGSEWNIYIDSDALLHPEFLDITRHVSRDTVVCYSWDVADTRWKSDDYFERDGRHIGWGNWFAVASSLCIDLWHPLDITLEEALENIRPTPNEVKAGVTPGHLIDDYTLSRNVARFGLKFKTIKQIWKECGLDNPMVQHQYTMTMKEQAESHRKLIETWGVESYLDRWKE